MAFNFPDTDGALTDGSFVHTEGDLVYAWNGQTWDLIADNSNNSGDVGEGITQDQADLRYVQQAGDNMTGDLTLGTDKIILDQDTGSGTYEGSLQSATLTDGSLTKTMTEVLTLVTTGGPVNTLQQVTDAGNTTTNRIESTATDGPFIATTTLATGAAMHTMQESADGASNKYFLYGTANGVQTFDVKTDGSVSFASGANEIKSTGRQVIDTTATDPNTLALSVEGQSGFILGASVGRYVYIGSQDSNTIRFNGNDGSAIFAGTVTTAGNFATTSSITIDNPTNTASEIVFSVQTGTLQQSKFRIKADGTTQIGNIDTGADTANITLSSTGEIDTVDIVQVNQTATNNASSMFLARNGSNTGDTDYKFIVKGQGVFIGENVDRTTNAGANIELAADGNATFAGYVESDLFSVSRLAVENKNNYYSKLAVNDTGNHFLAVDAGGNSVASINADGGARFAGSVRVLGDSADFRVGTPDSADFVVGTDGTTKIGTGLTGNSEVVKTQLNPDGSSNFNLEVRVEDTPGANQYAVMNRGLVNVSSSSNNVWEGRNAGVLTSRISNTGDAVFANQVSVGSLVIDGGDALTDYEEGTWTPSFTDITFLPGQTSNYNVFTRVGRLVHLTMRIPVQSSSTGGSISLPFTAVSATAAGTGTITDTSTGIAEGESIPVSVNGTGGVTAKIAAFTLTGNQTLDISLTYTTA